MYTKPLQRYRRGISADPIWGEGAGGIRIKLKRKKEQNYERKTKRKMNGENTKRIFLHSK
jgi:hypothetical protein